MTILTEALNRIMNWLQQNYPLGITSLKPGLSLLEIEESTKTLSFCLPQEVYELYQWKNGLEQGCSPIPAQIFFGMSLCNLDLAKELAQSFISIEEEEIEVKYMRKPLFPIFEFEGEFLAVVGETEKKITSPVIHISEIGVINIRYISLINMMLTLAESYESGAVYVAESEYFEEGILEFDEQKIALIYRKYNSE